MAVLRQLCLLAIIMVFQVNYCNSKNSTGTFHYIPLNNNGISYGDTNTTRCKSGEMIDLISYKFANNHTEEKFTVTEELELYQKCSMQERCTNLRFPSKSDQRTNSTYYVAIDFRCIDPKTSNIMNMCDNNNRSFSDTLHLMYNASATISATNCECYIYGYGRLSATLNDVRLDCSSNSLKINSKKLSCMENVINVFSVFQRIILFNGRYIFILLTLNSTSSPTMVWLKIKPTDTSTVTCTKTPSSVPTTKITPTSVYLSSVFTDYVSIFDNFTEKITTPKSESSVEATNSKGSPEGSNTITTTVVIIICVCATCVLCAIIIGVAISCKGRKRTKCLRNTECVHQTGSTEQVQAINPVSEEESSPFHETYVQCEHYKTGACECNTHGADASRSRFAVSEAVVENTETPDDGSYYNVRIKLASANETTHQAYFESQFHKQGACGYDTEAVDSKRSIQSELMIGSDALPDEDNY